MSNLKPLTILLAEDDEDHADIIVDTLEELNIGNKVIHVTNGEGVLKYLRKEPPFDEDDVVTPDLILLDQKMPGLDGVGALDWIKHDEKFKHIPVVMVSTSGNQDEIRKCFKLGANSYVTKPLQFEDFSRKIKELNLYWINTSELPVIS